MAPFESRVTWCARKVESGCRSKARPGGTAVAIIYEWSRVQCVNPEGGDALGQFLGAALPLDCQTRSSELSEMLLYLFTISSVVVDHKDTLLRVYLNYGLDNGWQVMPEQLFTLSNNVFSKIGEFFPNHSVFESNAISINSNSVTDMKQSQIETILLEGALGTVRLLDQIDLSRGQEYASFYKEMLNRTLQTSTILLDSAAVSQAAIAQKEDFEERFRNLQRVNERQREIFEAFVKLSKGLK